MQLGMIGLGRMGANIVRRLMRDGHECVVYDVNADAIAELEGEGATGARSLEEIARRSSRRRGPPGSWCPPPTPARRPRRSGQHLEAGDTIIDGGNSLLPRRHRRGPTAFARARHPLPRRRHQRRRVRPGARLLHDDRRRHRGRAAPRPDLPHARPRRGGRGAHPRPHGRPGPAGDGLPPLRAARRRPLREDGPQRDRVRDHGRLRRGPGDPEEGERGDRRAGPRRRDDPAARPGDVPVRHRHGRRRRGVAPRHRSSRRGCST